MFLLKGLICERFDVREAPLSRLERFELEYIREKFLNKFLLLVFCLFTGLGVCLREGFRFS